MTELVTSKASTTWREASALLLTGSVSTRLVATCLAGNLASRRVRLRAVEANDYSCRALLAERLLVVIADSASTRELGRLSDEWQRQLFTCMLEHPLRRLRFAIFSFERMLAGSTLRDLRRTLHYYGGEELVDPVSSLLPLGAEVDSWIASVCHSLEKLAPIDSSTLALSEARAQMPETQRHRCVTPMFMAAGPTSASPVAVIKLQGS